jgi:hypothetical protein
MHRCSWWVDPSGGHKRQRGKQPSKRQTEAKPSSQGSESGLPLRSLGRCV